jgi:hypothetical protein
MVIIKIVLMILQRSSQSFSANFNKDCNLTENLIPRNHRTSNDNLESMIITPKIFNGILCNKRANIAAGPGGIPHRILHDCADAPSPSLSALYNHSLQTRAVPRELKLADVMPIFKSEDKCDVANYRPISVTSSVCKLMEKIICWNFLDFLK